MDFEPDRTESAPAALATGEAAPSILSSFVMPDIDATIDDEFAPQPIGQDGKPIVEAPAPQQIDREAFFVVFSTAFDMPGLFMADLAPLAIAPEEKQQARAASDACYALLEIYYPAALMPGSETFAHLMVAAPFFIAKAMVVREIIRAKQAPPPKQVAKHTANDTPIPTPTVQAKHDEPGQVIGMSDHANWFAAGVGE